MYVQAPGQYRDLSVYVIDTGIYSKHNDFEDNQVQHGYTAQSIENEGTDVNTLSLGKTMKLLVMLKAEWYGGGSLIIVFFLWWGRRKSREKIFRGPSQRKNKNYVKFYIYTEGVTRKKKTFKKFPPPPRSLMVIP